MKTLLKHLISKIGNGLLVGIGIILSIGIFGIIYAFNWNTLPNVGSGSGLTASSWNNMIENINYLKDKFGTQTEGKMCTSVGGKVTCTSDLPSTSTLQTQITTLQSQVASLDTRACPTGTTMQFINISEDIYSTTTTGNTTDTCDGNGTAAYTCPTNASKTCTDNAYNAPFNFYYYRTVTCKLSTLCAQ